MAYSDFTLETVHKDLEVELRAAELFGPAAPVEIPPWLRETLARTRHHALVSEKARSELLVMPILLASRDLCDDRFVIYSGQRLDVDPRRGLVGECDFILALSPPLPILRSPVAVLLEAKKADIEAGLGQCAAQMVGARVFNEGEKRPSLPVFGCVTTGETWQFLRLTGSTLTIDQHRYYISELGAILKVFQVIIAAYPPEAAAA